MNPSDPFGLVGQVLDGQFRVEKLVGEGGFSTVYRGHAVGLNEPVAIKCLKLPPTLNSSLVDTFIQRFRDESRILYRLSQGNLNVVRSLGAGTTQSPLSGALVPYMALEWLEGRSLANDFSVRRAAGQKGRPLQEIVRLFESAADALAFAHGQGVVHRDLNPGNLFLTSTSSGAKMKVLDFGVAKLMDDSLGLGPRAATVGAIRIFAPAYGAPEQFDDRLGPIGAWSDVYAFALILMEAMRDRAVNEGEHLGDFVRYATDPKRRPTPRLLGIDVPDEVEKAFARATVLDPRERWQSAGELWQSFTIAMNVATERRYEQAARETPPLEGAKMAETLALANPPAAAKALNRTVAMGARPALAADLARTLDTNKPDAKKLPGHPGLDPGRPPTVGHPGGTERMPPLAERGRAAPKSDPTIMNPPDTSRLPSTVDEDEEEAEDEATKVRAPPREMLRTMAMNDASAAKARDAAVRAAAAAAGRAAPKAGSPAEGVVAAPRPAAGVPRPADAGTPKAPDTAPSLPNEPNRDLPKLDKDDIPADAGTVMMAAPPVKAPSPLGATQLFGSGAMPMVGGASTVIHNPAAAHEAQQQAAQAAQRAGAPFGAQQGGRYPSTQQPVAGHAPTPWEQGQPPPPNQGPPQPFMPSPYAQRPGEPMPYAPAAPGAPAKKPPIVALVVGGLLAVAVIGGAVAFFALRRSAPPIEVTPSASVSGVPVPTLSASAPPIPTASASVAVAADAGPEEADAGTANAGADAATPTTTATTTAPPPTATHTAPTPPPTAPTPPPTATSSGAKPEPNVWSESAARARLAQANGVLVICKKDGGLSGPGNATVTFVPDGTVASVLLDPPYADTKEGECAANQFRRVKINKFTGPPQTLRHSFEVPK